MDAPPFARVSVGDVLAGKFRVERILGSGGMGIVVAARHAELDELVAIKLMHPAELANAQAIARFSREAKAAAKLRSEHIARVFDAGKTDQGVPYMVLEYLEGCDLHELGKRRGTLAIGEAALYVMQTAEALVVAHAAGIIHRDLKPANLFLTNRSDGSPCIKVLDFGISKRVIEGRAPSGFTRTTDVMGSPQYMSPEQMRSTRDVDPRTDIWSLGAILYKLIAGEAPFAARSLADVYKGILEREPKRLGLIRPDVPPELEALVRRCLRKNPDDRFSSAAEVSTALASFAPEEEAPRSVRVAQKSRPAFGSQAFVQLPPSTITAPTEPSQDDVPTSRHAFVTLPSATLRSAGEPPKVEPAETKSSESTGAAWGATWSNSRRAAKGPHRALVAVALIAVVIGGAIGFVVSPDRRPTVARVATAGLGGMALTLTTLPPLPNPRGPAPMKTPADAAAPREEAVGETPAPAAKTEEKSTNAKRRVKRADPFGRSRK